MTGRRHSEQASWSSGGLAWEWDPDRGQSGILTVNGIDYDPAAGRLFLIRTDGGQVRVTQLRRDLSGLKAEEAEFQRMAKQDADVAPFVAEASKP
jgi:hypothetical protein